MIYTYIIESQAALRAGSIPSDFSFAQDIYHARYKRMKGLKTYMHMINRSLISMFRIPCLKHMSKWAHVALLKVLPQPCKFV